MISNEDPGSIFVVRNIANVVNNNDNNLMSALAYAVNVLKVPNIIVCGHYECEGVHASATTADHTAPFENWVQNIRDVYRLHKDELDGIDDPEQRHRRLVELNVKEQCINLFKTSVVQRSRIESFESGNASPLPRIHACVFDPKTGALKKLDFDFKKEIQDLHGIYALFSVNQNIDIVKRRENIDAVKKLEESINLKGPAPAGLLINNVDQSIKTHFPGALTTADFAKTLKATLETKGYTMEKTLLATSFCCDEINREFEGDLTNIFGKNFNIGGLSGAPFGGVTAFGAMTAHIPKGGDCCLVYGPHVGIDSNGEVGKVDRRGQKESDASCGSAQVALAYVKEVREAKVPKRGAPDMSTEDFADAQQILVNNSLLPLTSRILYSKEPMAELPRALFDVQDELMTKLIKMGLAGVGKHSPKGTIVKVGGIHINTPQGHEDHFYPLKFEIFDQKGEVIEDFEMKYNYIWK